VGVGVVWGVSRSLTPAPRPREPEPDWDGIRSRLDQIERAIRMATRSFTQTEHRAEHLISRDQLATALAAAESRVIASVDARIQAQSLSIGALKVMFRQTDSLLERVLEALESHWDESHLQDPQPDLGLQNGRADRVRISSEH